MDYWKKRSEKFSVQSLALNPLLLAIVIDAVTKYVREGVAKEFLYDDDLITLGNSWKDLD